MTLKTLLLLQRCLTMMKLDVGAEDFDEVAVEVTAAKRELEVEIDNHDEK